MIKFVQKSTISYRLFVFMLPYMVHASHSIQEYSQKQNSVSFREVVLEEIKSIIDDYSRVWQGVLDLWGLVCKNGKWLYHKAYQIYFNCYSLIGRPLQIYQVDPRILIWEKRNLLVNGYCRQYKVPTSLLPLIKNLLYGNKNKESLDYLVDQDLRGTNFTGCQFIGIKLTNSNLQGAILKNTTCNYLRLFEDNMKKNKRSRRTYYFLYISNLISMISYQLYPDCNDDKLKAKLLHIVCEFAELPCYKNEEVNIKFQYWFLQLKLLKDAKKLQLNIDQKNQILQVEHPFKEAINRHCFWETHYPQYRLNLSEENAHGNFNQYLQDFNKGCVSYQIDTEDHFRDTYYTGQIRNSILWLREVYPSIKGQALQQEACKIGKALSKSYQLKKTKFVEHYLTYQNRLVLLKKLAKKNGNQLSKITHKPYRSMSVFYRPIEW